MSDTRVVAYGRLHCTLVDLGRTTTRAFGGCGFATSVPVADIRIVPHTTLAWQNFESVEPRTHRAVKDAVSRLQSAVGRFPGAVVELTAGGPEHVGLGSKTALTLAVLAGLNASLDLNLSRASLQSLSGRGGTSGVGIHTFFDGGFVLDGGHPQASVVDLVPSSARLPDAVPPIISALQMPDDWDLWMALPATHRISGASEVAFFQANTPLPHAEVLDTLAAVTHGLCSAIAERDLDAFAFALRSIHRVGFKARELARQPQAVRNLLADLWTQPGMAAGMSSLGPLVYLVCSTTTEPRVSRSLLSLANATLSGPFPVRNKGRSVVQV